MMMWKAVSSSWNVFLTLNTAGSRAVSSRSLSAGSLRRPTNNPWHHLLLPPPPFVVCDTKDERPPKISSYAVVGGGGGGSGSSSLIYIAAEEGAGTYSLDTVRHTWSRLGDCALPFHGKVEYVPELKLWFGISSKDWTLAAADLSAMGSQTQLVSLVNLGCGRFCIVRFFYTSTTLEGYFDEVLEEEYSDEEYEEYFVILTGVEVVRCDNYVSGNDSKGKVELKMIKHNSMYHMCYDGGDGKIETAF